MTAKGENDKFTPKKWNSKSVGQLKKMTGQEKARYLAYETPSKEVVDAIALSQKRIYEDKLRERIRIETIPIEHIRQSENHAKLIGQLKSAEARNRIRVMRLRYQGMRAHEVKHLIACQPTSLRALRLEALVPPGFVKSNPGDSMDRLQRSRIEKILEDESGLSACRKLD